MAGKLCWYANDIAWYGMNAFAIPAIGTEFGEALNRRNFYAHVVGAEGEVVWTPKWTQLEPDPYVGHDSPPGFKFLSGPVMDADGVNQSEYIPDTDSWTPADAGSMGVVWRSCESISAGTVELTATDGGVPVPGILFFTVSPEETPWVLSYPDIAWGVIGGATDEPDFWTDLAGCVEVL